MKIGGKRALVTGAGGFIGSHLVEALLDAGAEVTALLHYNADAAIGNLSHVPAAVRKSVHVVHGDLLDADFMSRLVAKSEVVFHLGALIAIPYSYDAPRSYIHTNVIGTLNILEAIRSGGQRLVHTSTSEVYGSARYIPIDEVACCRFRGHRDKVFDGTGELECRDGSSAASSSLRR